MTIAEMHYNFKKKLNKLDSQQYRNLLVPEVDWALNEAQDILVRRAVSAGGDLGGVRTLVLRGQNVPVSGSTAALPADFAYFLLAWAEAEKGDCRATMRFFLREAGDDHERDPFRRSSFEWREANGAFEGDTVRVFDDGTFTIKSLLLDYVRKPKWMHAAADHRGGGYKMPGGLALTGTRDCELPDETHGPLVDLAVLIASGELHMPDYQVKKEKIGLVEN